jgi:lysozyme family protein
MSFDEAVAEIFEHEGGYVNDPNDPGGETIYGISRRSHPKAWEKGKPTVAAAKKIYKKHYWDNPRLHCSKLHPAIALCIFDSAVNQGARVAAKTAQDAINVKQDGWIGPITAKALNRNPKRSIERFMAARSMRYARLDKDDRKDDIYDLYGEGWMVRVLRVYEQALKLIEPKKEQASGKTNKSDKEATSKPKPRKKRKTA